MERITVGVDGSTSSEVALAWAIAEATSRGARLRIVHSWIRPFVGELPMTAGGSYQVLEGTGEEVLDGVCNQVDRQVDHPVERILSSDSPVECLLDAATTSDLLVVGSRGRGGLTAMLLGSVSSALAHHCPCPLVIVPLPPTPHQSAELTAVGTVAAGDRTT
jgi:nucleotide-binding universal stress UspA family protein